MPEGNEIISDDYRAKYKKKSIYKLARKWLFVFSKEKFIPEEGTSIS